MGGAPLSGTVTGEQGLGEQVGNGIAKARDNGLCAGWSAHPWLKARDRAVDTAPGHRASARCDQAASWGGRGASERADDRTSQHRDTYWHKRQPFYLIAA